MRCHPPATAATATTDKNQAELTEEEDSSLFFVQLPTKLPRPLPDYQRVGAGQDAYSGGGGLSGVRAGGKGKGKGKGKASDVARGV